MFQEYWDKQIDRLEKQGYGGAALNKLYEEAYKAWEAKPQTKERSHSAELAKKLKRYLIKNWHHKLSLFDIGDIVKFAYDQ